MKLDIINKGEEFDLPAVSANSDIQMTIDLLKMQIKTEKTIAKDIDVDVKEMRRELLRAQMEKDYVLSDDAKTYNSILAIQLNLDTAFYVLHRIDPSVTKEQVSKLGGVKLAEIVMTIFPPPEKTDFPKATPEVAINP